MKLLIGGGGTGGHTYPSIAIGNAFLRHGDSVVLVARSGSFEEDKYSMHGFRVLTINADKFEASRAPLFLANSMKGFFEASAIIEKEKPDLILGVGSYVSFPLILASINMNIPYFLYEQNIIPGRTNRFLKYKSKKVFLGFPDIYNFFGDKGVFTGNPVRFELSKIDKRKAFDFFGFENKPTLLVFGGSSGARRINILFQDILNNLLQKLDIQVIFIPGENLYNEVMARFESIPRKVMVCKYLEEMDLAYAVSDFAISRGGAMALTELVFFGIPSLIIPYPFARDDHQKKNAEFLRDKGCLEVVEEKFITPDLLYEKIVYYFTHMDIIYSMGEKCRGIFPENSEELIYRKIKEVMDA